MLYSAQVLDHFTNPRHVGLIDNPSGFGLVGDPGCGDFMCISITVEDYVITDVAFLCKGCPAAIASGSATTELACGVRLETAMTLTPETISQHLGGLPEEKEHCSNLGVQALHYAIADFLGLLPRQEKNGPAPTEQP